MIPILTSDLFLIFLLISYILLAVLVVVNNVFDLYYFIRFKNENEK